MAAYVARAHDDENVDDSTYESKIATYLSLKEQKLKQLNKNLNAAASQAEKEEVFREYLVSIFNEKKFITGSKGEFNEKWQASCNECLVVLFTLANKHGCMHILEEYDQLVVDDMQPGSGLRMQPLDEIMCANCTPSIAVCEKRGMMLCSEGCCLVKYCSLRCQKEHLPKHKVVCKSMYAETAWLKGSKYDTTAEDASGEPQIVDRRFYSKAIQFPSSATSLPTPCSACLAESGDLSDMVYTILSVPDGYEGEITLHLNHASPNIAFCNLLSLLAMGTLGELSCDMLIQLWYSVAMTEKQMLNITNMVVKLVQDSKQKVTKGPYCASLLQLPQLTLTVDLEPKLLFVMYTENTFESHRHIRKCMEDRDKHLLSPQGKRYAVEMLTTLSSHQRVSWNRFAEQGMLLPLGAHNAHHNVQNPFLFDVDNHWRPESQLDPLQCWPRAEIIAAGEKCSIPSNDIYGALFFLIRQKLSECIQKLSKHRFHIVVTCCEPSALVHRLQQSKTAIHYISGVDATKLQYARSDDKELSALSVRALKEIIQGAGLSTEGCLEKSDLVDRAALILGCAAPSDGRYSAAADATLPPTQQQLNEASKWRRFIEAQASLDPPDFLAVCYLARHGDVTWMKKGVDKSIPECLALYGWHQLCCFSSDNALSALSHLQRAKDMKNAYGLLYWGLVMDSAYGDISDACSVVWTCYYESACLGNEDGMFNVAHVLAARGDHKQAVVWWKKARQHGPSLFELYRCYHHGYGCTQDHLEARRFLQQAADQGYGPACAILSEWYGSGWKNVLRKNAKKQAHWSKQATISSEKHIYRQPLRSLFGTNATPAWWKCLRTVVELMERSGGGTKTEGALSAEVEETFDTRKFAFEGVEKFIMQMSLMPSNGGGLGADFKSTPLHYSFLLRAESLALTSDERLQLQGIVQEITDLLTRSRVITSVEVCGSFGKGTAVSGCADLDLVAITAKCFESNMYLSLQHHVATLLEDLKVDIKYKPLAVSFTYKNVGIDVVLASPNIEPLSQCYLPPRPRFFRRPSLSVQECAFLLVQPPLFGAVVRLLKNWRASAENWPRHSRPRSYLLELIALAAVQKVKASQFTEENVRSGFVTSLELLLQVISGNLKLYWVDNYPEYSIGFENHDGPIVMDPFDPTNNLAGLLQIQDWCPLSQLAEQTLIAIRDHNLVQRVIHITPTAEQSVSAISPQYRFSCFVLRAEQFVRAGNLEEALDVLGAASQIDNSSIKLQCLWYECITQLFAEECRAKQSPLTEAELLLGLNDAVVDTERVSGFRKEGDRVFYRPPNFVSKDSGACMEMDIPFSTYMSSLDEVDNDSSEEEDIPRIVKLFPEPSEDELYTPQITSVVWKSKLKDGKYFAWLILKQLTDKMPSKEQRDMYMRASLQCVLAHDALCVGKDVIGLDRMTASILATTQTTHFHELHALALAAAKRVLREVSSERHVLPHCGLSLQVAASIVQVHMHVMMKSWAKVREALKPLLKRDDLCNRADVCCHIGGSLMWTGDFDAAILWHERGIVADPTFHINHYALGLAMIYSKSKNEADPEQKSLILKTAEKHLWQYIKQGVPEDKKRCDAMYELVYVAVISSKFHEARNILEMAIEADIRRTEIYHEPCNSIAKQQLLVIETLIEQVKTVSRALRKDDPHEKNLFYNTVRTKLGGNPLLIDVDIATLLENVLSVCQHAMKEKMATSCWSGDKSMSEVVAYIPKNPTQCKDSDYNVGREDDVNEEQGEMKKGMQHIVVDCEGSGEFLSLGEALRSDCIVTGTVITMKGGTYKETILCIVHEHLTIRAESSKEKVVIQSYYGILVAANHVTLSGLTVDLLSPKGYDGVEELNVLAIHVRVGIAVVLENCSAFSVTGAAIGIGDRTYSNEIEVTMVMCNARSSVGNAFVCEGSHTKVQMQQCNGTYSKNGLEVRMGATAHVRSSYFSCNKNSGVLVWHNASVETVVGPDNVIQDNQGSGALLASRGIIFHHNKVTGNKLYGVNVQADPAPGFKDVEVKVEDCKLFQNGLGGVQFCMGMCGVISGCHIKENNVCGIMVGMGVEKLSITGNRIQGNYSLQETGIVMLGRAKVADNNKFSNNRMTPEKEEEFLKTVHAVECMEAKSEKANEFTKSIERKHEGQRRRDILVRKLMAPHLFGRLQCAKCGAEGGPRKKMLPCVKCNEVVYCSTQCLEADANQHEESCNPVPFYETYSFDAEHLQRMQAERENARMVCANCNAIANKEPYKKCAKCKCAAYCSKECQKKHWPVHKTVCKSAFVTVKATTQNPWDAKHSSMSVAYMYMGPDGSVRIGDPMGVYQLSSDAVAMVIKIQGSEDDLIMKNTLLQFYNQNRSVSGWIQASMNNTGELKNAYALICDTIIQFGDAGRWGGKKGYFQAVVQRDMEVKVNCVTLVAENIEW